LVTELDSISDDLETYLQDQYEADLIEQNARDCQAYEEFIGGSGFSGRFWDELDDSS